MSHWDFTLRFVGFSLNSVAGFFYKQSSMRDWPGSGPTDGHALLRGVNDLCVPAAFLDGSGYTRCKSCCILCVSLVIMRA